MLGSSRALLVGLFLIGSSPCVADESVSALPRLYPTGPAENYPATCDVGNTNNNTDPSGCVAAKCPSACFAGYCYAPQCALVQAYKTHQNEKSESPCTRVTGPVYVSFDTWFVLLCYFVILVNAIIICLWFCLKKCQPSRAHHTQVWTKDMEMAIMSEHRLSNGSGEPAAEGEDVALGVTANPAALKPAPKSVSLLGYRSHWLGNAAKAAVWCQTGLWWLIMFIGLIDMYIGCQFTSADNMCFFGNYPMFGNKFSNGVTFMVTWLLCCVWLGVLLAYKDTLSAFFFFPCDLNQAQMVQVSKEEADEPSFTLFPNECLKCWRKHCTKKAAVTKKREACIPVQVDGDQRYFVFECSRYCFNEANTFERYVISIEHLGLPLRTEVNEGQPARRLSVKDVLDKFPGLTEAQAQERLKLLGPNMIPYAVDTMWESLMREFSKGTFLYQIMMYSVWLWASYLIIAALVTSIVLFQSFINLFNTRKAQQTILELTRNLSDVAVCRDKKWVQLRSDRLVPGDLIQIQDEAEEDNRIPCDCVLVKGACVMDESGLTGESKPVRKVGMDPTPVQSLMKSGANKRHTVFAGTRVLSGSECYAIVTGTSTNTSKGDLLTAVLYPKNMMFKYDEETGMAYFFLYCWAFLSFVLTIVFVAGNGSCSSIGVAAYPVYGIFVVSQVVSPLLPLALTVGETQASIRLQAKRIYTLNPKRIAISGKVRVYCFDKTGTLTKEGLDFIGVCTPSNLKNILPFSGLEQAKKAGVGDAIFEGCVSCHANSIMKNQLVGNEVEVNMFKATGYQLMDRKDGPPLLKGGKEGGRELTVLRRFEFDHVTRTMSVLVKAGNEVFLYTKGAPESVSPLCKADSLPANHQEAANFLASDGCYVLGLSKKSITPPEDVPKDEAHLVQWAAQLARKDAEVAGESTFNGLILFRNELKIDTAQALEGIKEGHVRCVMITGDNAYCGGYIARASGMLHHKARVLLAEMKGDDVAWRQLGELSEETFTTTQVHELIAQEETRYQASNPRYAQPIKPELELAVTGPAIQHLLTTGFLEKYLFHMRIFARASPEEKVMVVELFMARGLVVGMTGDGGNDCGALRAAHVGVALSEADASVVSPFSAKSKSVMAIFDLLREGRAALATSFASWKFIISYGLLFSTTKLLSYLYGVLMANMSYIVVDGLIVASITYAMNQVHPAEKLTKERPTSSLLGPVTVVGIAGVFFIHLIGIAIAVAIGQSSKGYTPFPVKFSTSDEFWYLSDNTESGILFSAFALQLCSLGITFSLGGSFRKPVYAAYAVMVVWGIFFIMMSCIMLVSFNASTAVFHMYSEPFNSNTTSATPWIISQHFGCECPSGTATVNFESLGVAKVVDRYSPGLAPLLLGAKLGCPCPTSNQPFLHAAGRWGVWLALAGSSLCACFFEKFVVTTGIADFLRKKYPSNRPEMSV